MTASPTDEHASAKQRIQELTKQLSEAREQQAATAEILRAISKSPSDIDRIFQEIATTAAHLCAAYDAGIFFQADGESLRLVAHHGPIPPGDALPLKRGFLIGRAVLERRTIHVADLPAESQEYPEGSDRARRLGHRTIVAVPLIRASQAIGAIAVRRTEMRPFTDRQIALLETFADQAVIAIENTRLFEAEQTRSRQLRERTQELTEALEYQTATSEVLGVITASAADIQPVLQTLVESACRLCAAYDGIILLREGDWLQVKAHHGPISANVAKRKITRDWVNGRCVADGVQIHVQDLQAEAAEYPEGAALAQRLGARTILATPLMRESESIGAIMIRRDEVRPFTDRQIELLRSFADQAVIAIENTRLFEAQQASKRELTEALEQQTATADVLKVISRSALDVQKVLDALVESAARLCDAGDAAIFQVFGDSLRLVAHHGQLPISGPVGQLTLPLVRGRIVGRAVLDRRTIQVADVLAEANEYPESRSRALQHGWRTLLVAPLVHAGEAIGVILIRRREVRPFTERQIELVNTFADQAVIAIENTRLFEEVQARTRDVTEALEYQTATSEVLAVISRSKFDLQPVLDELVASAAKLCQAEIANMWRPNGAEYRLAASYGIASQREDWLAYRKYLAGVAYRPGRGSVVGRTLLEGRTIQIDDIRKDPDYDQRGALAGVRTMLGVPLLRDGRPIGVMVLVRAAVRRFADKQVELIETFADQAVIAIENARLFEEVQARTRELAKTVEDLEIASQHKNQFVANMSHELRTPLAAILGYAELIQEGFYGALPEKSLNALTRIRSNGKHLLGLINTVLDIAKIESGQFTLNMSEYAIESVVETVRAATESLAQNKKLTLTTSVEMSLPVGLGDEQRLTQVLLNLVGNAIKFTDAGEVSIAAGARNGHFAVSVTDTGPGIPLDQQERIFEQFHQVDSSMTKPKGGTGLGLAIAKQIVEMHGGRIWVVSTPGKGSTFQMELPTRAEFRKPAQP
jgi:signal transduction histidine kinase